MSHSKAQAIAAIHPADALQRAIDISWLLVVSVTCVMILQLLPSSAHAAGSSGTIKGVICDVAIALSRGTGPIIASLAVCTLGIGALFGKTSWTLAITTTVGIAIIIGADSVLQKMFGKNNVCPSTTSLKLTELNDALCAIVRSMTSGTGIALASGSVFILGFSAFFGRISWGPAIALGAAISAIFGSVNLVNNVTQMTATGSVCNISATLPAGTPSVTNPGVTGPSGIETPGEITPIQPNFENGLKPAYCRLDPTAPGC